MDVDEEVSAVRETACSLDHQGIAHKDMAHSNHSMMHGLHDDINFGQDNSMFHGGYAETILFSWWKVTEKGQFAGSFFAIFIVAILYEGLKYYRKHLLWKTYAGLQYCAVAPPDKGIANVCAPDEPQIIQ
ncbi:High affinity copper uptake protein 1 [Eumeta japonica]|uniref:Copper transport protein n=1 Tax=Eumeta variegata TaxID=151549 RepID=A0A4C1WVP1_EUMVA|nr:High affinity copper uptake protein 1 [Eumeta japonica]